MNNIPTMLIRDDFQAHHKDMLISACCEPLSKEEIEARRNPVSMRSIPDYIGLFSQCIKDLKDLDKQYEDKLHEINYNRIWPPV